MQGIADEGTPPRNLGDTYSQSTDPSDDEEEDIADHSYKPDASAALDRHALAREAPSSSAQPAQQHQSLEGEPSVALDTQNNPADNMDMQEGEGLNVLLRVLDCAAWHQALAASAKVATCR